MLNKPLQQKTLLRNKKEQEEAVMYLVAKNGMTCRIPDNKAAYYKKMGYNVKKIGENTNKNTESNKKVAPEKRQIETK